MGRKELKMTDTNVVDNTESTGSVTPTPVEAVAAVVQAVTPASIVTATNTLVNNVTLAAVPVSMLNGTLKSADSGLASLKAQLDADILAAQSKAKTAAALVLTTVKAAIADVDAWIESTPGQTLVVIPSKKTSDFLAEVEALIKSFPNTLKNVEDTVGKDVSTLESKLGFWSKFVAWLKG